MAKADLFNPALSARQTLWLIAASTAALAPLATRVPTWLAAGVGAVLLWRAWIWLRGRALPPRWLLTLLVLAGTLGVALSYRSIFGRDPGGALLVLFLALKLMELRTQRDGVTAVFLCYFLQITVYFHSQEPLTAALSAGVVLLATAALVALNDDSAKPPAALRRAGLLLAQGLPFMLILFVLFPRVAQPLWAMPVDAWGSLSGLSDTMSPGSISQLSLSGGIALRAQFEGDLPARDALYWRGPVLSHFDGRTWRQGRQTQGERPPYETEGPATDYTVTLEAHNKLWLFALDLPGSVPPDAVIASDYQVLAKGPVRSRSRYAMRSYTRMSAGADQSTDTLRGALQLPPDFNPRARALALEWRSGAAEDPAVVQRALAHFRQTGFVYTLTPPLLGQHSVDEFLFETRRGFCEHYAGAFVFLMRAAGVPARVVTGYQGGEINPVDGYLTVRHSDAHAWAEVWIAGRGWLRVDPTAMSAPARVSQGLAAAVPVGEPLPFAFAADLDWLRGARFRWEALSNTWNQWVLGYNELRQRELLSGLGMKAPDWRSMTALLALLCGAAMLALTAWALRQRVGLDPAQRAWERLSRKLRRQGLARQAWEGPLAYAERVGRARPGIAAQIRAIAAAYIDLRYGPEPGRTRLRELRRAVRALDP